MKENLGYLYKVLPLGINDDDSGIDDLLYIDTILYLVDNGTNLLSIFMDEEFSS